MRMQIEFNGPTEDWAHQSFTAHTPEGVWVFRRGTRPSVSATLNGGGVPVDVISTKTGSLDKGPHVSDGWAVGYTHIIMEVEVDPTRRELDAVEMAAKRAAERAACVAAEKAKLGEWVPSFIGAAYAAKINPLPILRQMFPAYSWEYFHDAGKPPYVDMAGRFGPGGAMTSAVVWRG